MNYPTKLQNLEYSYQIMLTIDVQESAIIAASGVAPLDIGLADCDHDKLLHAVDSALTAKWDLAETCGYGIVPRFTFRFDEIPAPEEIQELGNLLIEAMAPVVRERWEFLSEEEDLGKFAETNPIAGSSPNGI